MLTLPPKPRLYALSLSYMDQMSWAAARLKSLQCWATTWTLLYSVSIVEPFVTNGARLGVPTDLGGDVNLKFGDIFDTTVWNSLGIRKKTVRYPELVSWGDFVQHAPRGVVAVQIVYNDDYRCTENESTEQTCGSARLNATLSQVLTPHNFTLLKQVCINFRTLGALSVQDFNHLIFDPVRIPKRIPVTVIFDEWRGPGDKEKKEVNKCFIRIAEAICTPNNPAGHVKDLTRRVLSPSPKIVEAAKAYISQYLNDTLGYVAVLIRWEKLLLSEFYGRNVSPSTGAKCVTQVLDSVESMYSRKGMKTAFFTTDIGRFGSSTFNLNNVTQDSIANVTTYTETLLGVFHNKSISLADYDQRFEDFAGTSNPAVIAQLQKTIAAHARCLVLVGWGTFHENLLQMYKRLHPKEVCREIIQSC